MNILIIVAEVAPFSQVGGLSRGTRFLAKALVARGHNVKILTPGHGCVMEKLDEYKKVDGDPEIYFINHPDYFGLRSRIYGYGDDYKRYYYFSKACLDWLMQMKNNRDSWIPDLIQCHDWHTGYFVDLIKNDLHFKKLSKIPVLFTVHNFKYQNETKFQYFGDKELDTGKTPLASINSPLLSGQNALVRGMIFADWVNTVSPTHSREILSDEYSYNLGKTTNKIRNKLSGILNGLDYEEFDPLQDPLVKYNFSEKNFREKKRKNKDYLRKLFSLKRMGGGPLINYVGRMTSQKGLETMIGALRKLMVKSDDVQFIALGDGEDHYCELMWELKKDYPGRVGVKIVHDINLPRQIFAGSDITLVPSNFEPGGIVVLESLRYGAVPIVRRTGGLNDIIRDFSARNNQGNGFSFKEKNASDLYRKVISVLDICKNDRKAWDKIIINCLRFRRTWNEASEEYEKLFRKII